MINITAIVLTKNEEKNIIDCLESVLFCDEIIVVDDDSTDRTEEIIDNFSKEHTKVNFYKRSLNFNFSKQRKFGISKASNDWILFVDADERITDELKQEIKDKLLDNDLYSGFLIPRADFIWGKELVHGETGGIRLLRLFDRREGELKGKVHESWVTEKSIGRINNPIIHYPHPTISEFLKEINFYTDLRAEELFMQEKKVNAFSIILYPVGKFVKNYIFKMGFLDGVAGLVHAVLMSFHSFMVRGKLWQLWQKK